MDSLLSQHNTFTLSAEFVDKTQGSAEPLTNIMNVPWVRLGCTRPKG